MLREITARGPIACCMATNAAFHNFTGGGVFTTTDPRAYCDHLVSVVGFGEARGGPYWTVQNSFGSAWGEAGYFRIGRSSGLKGGQRNLGIEALCSWVMPAL